MRDVTFICYAHENIRFVERLAQKLQEHGVPVWLDQWEIAPAESWDVAITRAVRECSHFLLVLSPPAVRSWSVRQQYLLAKETNKIVVPILRQPCQVPVELRPVPPLDFTADELDWPLSHLLRSYFPEQARPVESPSTSWSIRKFLTSSRWPPLGSTVTTPWLGPSILLLALFVSTLFLWPSEANDFSPPTLALETLAVIPTATPLPFVRPIDNKAMAFVPAGKFLQGSPETDPEADRDEMPQRQVYIAAFWIDQTEVTNGDYRRCVSAGGCTPSRDQGHAFAGVDYPVVGVDWFQAVSYCQWAGGRLPTEAEWEKAARGTDGRIYPWGNLFDGSRLNSCDQNCIQDWRDSGANDDYKYTAPVGSYPAGASPYGVLDMSGNVWEWVFDWYAEDYYQHGPLENPQGPAFGQQRVIRGGSWHYAGRNLRAVNRHKDIPTFRYDKIGFRCVVDDEAVLERR